jgi:hypothetical protein
MISSLHFIGLMTCWALNQWAILQCLYAYFWTRFALISDNFLASFALRFNLMMSGMIMMVQLTLGQYEGIDHRDFLAGENLEKLKVVKQIFPL